MAIKNQHALDIANGWIETDPDTEQRVLPPKKEGGLWAIRQRSSIHPEYAIEAGIYVDCIDDDTVSELIDSYGYDDSIRDDEDFPRLLVEMEFETNLVNEQEAELDAELAQQ